MRLSAEGVRFGVNWANVFWVRNGSQIVPSQTDLAAFCNFFHAAYSGNLMEHVGADAELELVSALYYEPNGDVLGAEYVQNQAGSAIGSRMPNQVSTCISWLVQQRYRGGHPRTYLPPPPQENSVNGVSWTTAHQDATRLAANNFHNTINGHAQGPLGDLHLGTVSFVLRNAWRTPPVFRDFTLAGAQVDGRIDTQRRRLGPDI